MPPRTPRLSLLPLTPNSPSALQARNRLIAVKTAKATAAIEQEGSASGWDAMQASEASAHGGSAARQYLLGLHSLRRIDKTTVEELLDAAAVAVPRLPLQRSRSFTAGGRRRSRSGSGRSVRAAPPRGLYSAPTSPIAAPRRAAPVRPQGFGVPAEAAEGSSHGGAASHTSGGSPPSNRSRSRGGGSDSRRSGSWSLPARRLLSALRSQSLPEEEGAAGSAANAAAAGAGSPAWGASSHSVITRAANAGSPHALRPLRPASAASGSGLLLSEYDIESRGDGSSVQFPAGGAAELPRASIHQGSSNVEGTTHQHDYSSSQQRAP